LRDRSSLVYDTAAAFTRFAQLADGSERDALRDELVRAWLSVAERIAGRYRGKGEPYEDLRQVAALGLVKAVDGYDPDRGHAFESYAVPTVTGEIKRRRTPRSTDTYRRARNQMSFPLA
jgi:RNA polymerase sigma-B factor